jgi:hypothetical protein
LAVLGLLLLPGAASAAAPGATTGAASGVTDIAATLNGTVNPNKEQTNYHFDYGTTTSYGSRVPAADASAGGGNGGKGVSQNVSGLAPNTTYHFRLVATNPSGTTNGADATFTTTSTPAGATRVSLAAAPGTIVFGHATTLSGQITGPNHAGKQVTLEQNPFPFTGRFTNVTTATSGSDGKFSFAGIKPGMHTQYRVSAKTSPPQTSSTVLVKVKYALSIKLSSTRVKRGGIVRFSGVVKPAADGHVVLIQKRTRTGKFRTISRTVAKHSSGNQSSYAKRVRIRGTGVYRTYIAHDASHGTGTSRAKRITAT